MTIGEIVSKYCKEHSITFQQFAVKCSLSKGYVSMLINEKNPKTGKPLKPTIETYQNIADGMHMTLDELFEVMDDAPVRLNKKSKGQQLNECKLSEDERMLIEAFRAADSKGRFRIIQVCMNELDAAESRLIQQDGKASS